MNPTTEIKRLIRERHGVHCSVQRRRKFYRITVCDCGPTKKQLAAIVDEVCDTNTIPILDTALALLPKT